MSTSRTNEELVEEIQKGINTEENKVQLYRQNKGLILLYAKKYMRNEDELEDYLSEGYFAVEKACHYYEPERGAVFSSILCYYLHDCFSKYTREGRLVGIPRKVRANGVKYSNARSALLMEKGEVNNAEIMKKCELTENNIEYVMSAGAFSVIDSLDEPVLQQDGSTANLAEIVAADYDLEKSVTEKKSNEILWECVSGELTKKRAEIIKMYYQDGLNLSQIAKVKGITRQATSDSLKRSMVKLRESEKLKKLYECL